VSEKKKGDCNNADIVDAGALPVGVNGDSDKGCGAAKKKRSKRITDNL